MSTGQTYPELEQGIERLGARIADLKSKMNSESKPPKIADLSRLIDLQTRHAHLTEKLADLGRGGFGLLRRVKEELCVMEDDFTSFLDEIANPPTSAKREQAK